MVQKSGERLADLYLADETAWLDTMAELIRTGRHAEVDHENLAEYLEDMAQRDRREVRSRLRLLMAHLLKWLYQKEMRTPSWRETINNQRRNLEDELLTSKTLRNYADSILAETYAKAIADAAEDTQLSAATFPAECPWTLDQLLSPGLIAD